MRDATDGWRREIERVEATALRIKERSDMLCHLGLDRQIVIALDSLAREVDNRKRRLEAVNYPRLLRFPYVMKILATGGYEHFSGWKSAIKDLIRP